MTAPPTIYYSYAPQDHALKQQLVTFLKPISDHIVVWAEDQIQAGDHRPTALETARNKAIAAVLLISSDYLATKREKLDLLIQRALRKQIRLLRVPLRASLFQNTPLAEIEPVWTTTKPVADMRKEDRGSVWLRLNDFLMAMLERRTPTEAPEQLSPKERAYLEQRLPSWRLGRNKAKAYQTRFYDYALYVPLDGASQRLGRDANGLISESREPDQSMERRPESETLRHRLASPYPTGSKPRNSAAGSSRVRPALEKPCSSRGLRLPGFAKLKETHKEGVR